MPSFTRAGLLGSASLLALAAPLIAIPAAGAPKGDAAEDVATLNTELPVARAAVKAYADAAATNVLTPPVLAVTKQFAADHQAHATSIAAAIEQLGGAQAAESGTSPAADIASLKSEADILGALYALERATAAAYLAALGNLRSRDLARTTGSMLGVVTTHVALLAEALRQNQPYPSGFVTA